MASVGEILRTEREKRRLTISSVAHELRITEPYLTAIEEDDVRALPGAFFYKSFVRQYARQLGFDPGEFEQEIALRCEPQQKQDESGVRLAPATAVKIAEGPGISSQVFSFLREAAERLFSPPGGRSPISGTVVSIFMLTTAGVAGWVGLPKLSETVHVRAAGIESTAPQQRAQAAESVPDAPPAAEEPPANVQPEGASAPSAQQSAPAPVPTPTATNIASAQAVPTVPTVTKQTANGSNLKLTATEMTWLAVTDQGRVLFSGVLRAGESKTFADLTNATVRLGNAGGIEAEWNGQSTGSLGNHGDVRTVRLTPEGVKVYAPGGQL